VTVDLDALITAAEFRTATGGMVSLAVVGMWRDRGLIKVRDWRGRRPLYRYGDLVEVERSTRQRVRRHGGRRRAVRAA
jgi:hypothetical protein